MDINIVIKKGVAYATAFLLTLIPLFFAMRAFQKTFAPAIANSLTLLLFAAVSVVFNRIKPKAEEMMEQTLFKERYSTYETLRQFGKSIVSILDLKELTGVFVQVVSKAMGSEKASLFLRDDKGHYVPQVVLGLEEKIGQGIFLLESDPLPRFVKEIGEIVIREELEIMNDQTGNIHQVVDQMSCIDSEICLPFFFRRELVGFCNLGYKEGNSMYSHEDLQLLTLLSSQMAIAIANARLHEYQVHSQKLVQRADRLRMVGNLAAGLAHEIRNPLTPIKVFVEMAPERRNDEAFMGRFNQMALEEVGRIERLIDEVLGYTRAIETRLAEEDLNEIVGSSLLLLEAEADKRNITIKKEFARTLPKVNVDKQQIKQVCLNLYLNAFDAMPTGGELIVKTHLIKKEGRPWVQIEVSDTGCGIPEENLEQIFDPFFTTKHSSKEREGTGLGLSIVHQIVQEHQGTIEVKSKVKVGTTFLVTLPLA